MREPKSGSREQGGARMEKEVLWAIIGWETVGMGGGMPGGGGASGV